MRPGHGRVNRRNKREKTTTLFKKFIVSVDNLFLMSVSKFDIFYIIKNNLFLCH
jgi:hypothetical protein